MADENQNQETPKTYSAEEYDKLKQHNETLFKEAKSAKERAKLFEGLDPEEARNAKTKLLELEQEAKANKAGITSGQLEKLRADVRADLEKDYSPFKSTAEKLAIENRSLKLDSKVKDQMGRNGVRAERIEALFRLAGQEFDLTEDGVPMVKGKPGTPVEKYIAEDLSTLYPEFFVGTGSSGSGASKSTNGVGGAKSIAADDSAGFLANLKGVADGSVKVRQ